MEGRKSAAEAFPQREDWRPPPVVEPSRRRLQFTAVLMSALACASVVNAAMADGFAVWVNGAAALGWASVAAYSVRRLTRRTGERDS